MPSLLIQCQFIAHSYTGVRQNRDRRDELDWPPAPARLHQALIASSLVHLPESLRAQFANGALEALRWLESLPPPDIIASRLADDSGHRRALMVAMPHNSPAKGDFARYHPDLAPVLRATDHEGPLFVAFRWTDEATQFSREAELHLSALREAAAKMRYIGRAEDRVLCEVRWQEDAPPDPVIDAKEVWRPSVHAEDAVLLTARKDSTDELMIEFTRANQRRAREAKSPARLFLREQSYARSAAEALGPVHVAIFQIFEDGNPDALVCDAINAHRWRSSLRALACTIAKDTNVDRWNERALAEELISGHRPDGGRTQQPHLAFVPLPSLSHSGKADGRVRRFALVGYANAVKAADASSIYRTLAASMDGEEIEAGYRIQLVEDFRSDKVWLLYTRASRRYVSVTPLAIDRGYKVPTRAPDGTILSNNERHLRRQAEWQRLVRASLRHVHVPEDLVDSCQIQLTAGPLVPATERAERYRPKNERARFVHACLTFCRPVRGPLLVGDRRYQGFGLFLPDHF